MFLVGDVVEVKEGTDGREGLRKRKTDCGTNSLPNEGEQRRGGQFAYVALLYTAA